MDSGTELIRIAETCARMEQAQKDTAARLFGGEGQTGVLTFIVNEQKEIKERVTVLENWKLGSSRWVKGAIAVLSLEGTALGIYFSKLANHVSTLVQVHK